MKRTSNTALYNELVAADSATFPRDDAWVESVDRKAAQALDRLEAELNGHKTSLVKEHIRVRQGPAPERDAPALT